MASIPTLEPFTDFLTIPDVVEPIHTATEHHLTLKAKTKRVKLHKDLPLTDVWSYQLGVGKVIKPGVGSSYLGPTINVNRGEGVEVRWANKIKTDHHKPGKLPYEVVKIDPTQVADIPQNVPGKDGILSDSADPMRLKLKDLSAFLVTHLHGGRSQADSDGWPDNTTRTDQSNYYSYQNNQAAAMLWYHDHANHVTRLNVFAGLAGVWLIRDEEESLLNLPDCDYELPLVIQDRNLDVEAGQFTGKLLHKTEVNGGPAEFFGPYTLVNGKIWPKAAVDARLYRLRVLNGCNARTYRLVLLDAQGASQHANINQIGCDQGLMEYMVAYPPEGLVIAPGERVDLLVDFNGFQGQSLYLWNTAEAPFSNSLPITADPTAELAAYFANNLAGNIGDDGRRPYPQVMRFDVDALPSGNSQPLPNNRLWLPDHPTIELSPNMPIRLMALVEKPPMDATGTAMLVFWEYVEDTDKTPAPAGAEIVSFSYVHPLTNLPIPPKNYWKGAEEFYDRINWKIHLGDVEQWYMVNVSPDTHPIHVHLVDMKVTQTSKFDVYVNGDTTPLQPDTANGETTPVVNGNVDPITNQPLQKITKIVVTTDVLIPDDQTGPKDTIRINPGEIVGVAMKFSPYCGKYMYHCHILEHEDDDMMRPFVIVDESIPHHSH
jgi:FtsP/CotA-like multicopper oxidase with cupredoxin domain